MNADFDPTLDSCCARDEAMQKQASEWKSELHRLDPVEQRLNQVRMGGALAMMPAARHGHAHAARIENGTPVETDECNLFDLIETGKFFLCLAATPELTRLEKTLLEYLEGFPAPIVVHRFRPHSSCQAKCFVTGTMQLPSLMVFCAGKQLMVLERNRIESETESGLIARLSRLKQSSEENKGDDEEDDHRETTGRNKFFQCGKQGCDRTFHHVHVQSQFKYKQNDGQQSHSEEEDDDSD
ncbi:hypothetical protein BASA81_002686 [Batrachochytrium salamandrivorans]|nr:hypothetical protein BASA81_002686 [Batrachochytrium salamandrivorans]